MEKDQLLHRLSLFLFLLSALSFGSHPAMPRTYSRLCALETLCRTRERIRISHMQSRCLTPGLSLQLSCLVILIDGTPIPLLLSIGVFPTYSPERNFFVCFFFSFWLFGCGLGLGGQILALCFHLILGGARGTVCDAVSWRHAPPP